MDFLLQKIEQILRHQKKWKKWQKVVVSLACIVVFITTYALILPAITMDRDEAKSQGGIFWEESQDAEETVASADEQGTSQEGILRAEEASLVEEPAEDGNGDFAAEGTEELVGAGIASEENTEATSERPAAIFDEVAGDVTVHVEAPEGAFPTGTTMRVEPVADEQVMDAVQEVVEESVTRVSAVDIIFLDALGNEIEPGAEIRVSMSSSVMENVEQPVIVHVDEEGVAETVESEQVDGSVVFESDRFSVYVLVETEIQKEIRLTTPDGEDVMYVVSVTYDSDAEIPEGAYLDIDEFDKNSQDYSNVWDIVVASKKSNHEVFDETAFGLIALDISIKDAEGNPVEPAQGSKVTVSIHMNSLPEGADEAMLNETMKVQHLNESSGEVVVETVAQTQDVTVEDGKMNTQFTVANFSTFTISWDLPATNTSTNLRWRYNNNNTRGSVTVRYVDSNGQAINRPASIGGNKDIAVGYGNFTSEVVLADVLGLNIGDGAFESAYIMLNATKREITRVVQVRSGTYSYSTSYYNGNELVYSNNGTGATNYTRPDIYMQYGEGTGNRVITVHYGEMNGDEFVEYDSLPVGAQTSYGAPAFRGDQLNLRYEISGKDFVTVRMGDPSSGTQISPLLQTENQANYASNPYWKYRILDTLDVNNGINEWQQFTSNEDLYVVYRDTPTEKSYDDQSLNPEELSAPVTNKDVKSNLDGTYDVSLSVTDTSNPEKNKTHANVVIVLDTSSSMDTTDTGVAGQSRLQAAQNAIINVLADELFGFNTVDDPATIEVAFVDFSHRVRNEMTKDTIYSGVINGTGYNQFISLIRGLNDNGGTNYDTAIEAANSILWNDADPVYVIFVTDGDTVSRGYLEYNENGDTFPTDWDGGTYYNAAGGDYLERARSAAKVQVNKILANSDNRFYSIGVFGNVQYLQDLGGTYLGQANNETAIREAFTTIVGELTLNFDYESVEIHDGITDLTSTAMVNGDVNNFSYAVTKNGVTTTYVNGADLQSAYPDIGLASYADKQVTWNMGDGYKLEDGVTYTVTFTVWPSQDAYDYLADFSNNVKNITEQSDDTKAQFFVKIGSSTYQYVADKGWTTDIPAKDSSTYINDTDMQNAIDGADSVEYFIRTNTSASIDYTSVKYVNGEESERNTVTGGEIRDPNGKMNLDTRNMKVSKEFVHNINSADPYRKLNFYLKRDGKYYNIDGTTSNELDPEKVYTIELPKNGKWWDEIYIAPGLIEKEADQEPKLPPLESGHDYTVEEIIVDGNEFEYEFTPQIVRPMVIGTKLAFLVKKDKYNTNSANAKEYVLENVDGDGTSTYYVASENDGALIGTNRKTSELDITKVISGVTTDSAQQILSTDPRYKESFTYRVALSVPADGNPCGIMGYEYVPRLSDAVNNTTRVNIFGYQDDTGCTTFAPDTTRFKGRTYGAWNTQVYKYFVETYTDGTQVLVKLDENGDFTWLKNGDGISAAKKETIEGKEYYTITLDVTIKMDEVFRFTNLPSGTKYKIQEIYWNKYKADSGSSARTIVSDEGNINESGYEIMINTVGGSVSGTDVNNDTVSGTIEELDTRYYNQFVNTLTDEPDIIQLQVTKHLLGYDWSGERYYFRLTAIDGAPMPATLNNQAYISSPSGSDDKSYAFGYIRFTSPGTYQYKITELDPVTAGISGYTAVERVSGYGTEKIITITVNEELKVTGVIGEDTTYNNDIVNTTFTNTKGILVQLLKLGDGDFNKPLDGVTFELYEDQACTKKVTKDSLGNDIGTNGTLTTTGGGLAHIGKLAPGTYYLKEIGTVGGYNKLTDLISIEVKTDGTVSYNHPSFSNASRGPDLIYQDAIGNYYYYSRIRGDETNLYSDSVDYNFAGYRIVVSNSSGKELPHTGGSGTLPYTLGGIALILASALMYGFRMRRGERRFN